VVYRVLKKELIDEVAEASVGSEDWSSEINYLFGLDDRWSAGVTGRRGLTVRTEM